MHEAVNCFPRPLRGGKTGIDDLKRRSSSSSPSWQHEEGVIAEASAENGDSQSHLNPQYPKSYLTFALPIEQFVA
jgi:hypothetical protein